VVEVVNTSSGVLFDHPVPCVSEYENNAVNSVQQVIYTKGGIRLSYALMSF
jgi:hypothetical protein